MQNTSRSQTDIPQDVVDLATNFSDFNLTATLFGQLELIAQYRIWATKGNDLLAERNQYSQIVNFREYEIEYNENLFGAGLQYAFSEKTHLRLMWQSFAWDDAKALTLPYILNTYTLFFTMNF